MKELWALLLSAQNNASGVPQQFLEAKEEEMRNNKVFLVFFFTLLFHYFLLIISFVLGWDGSNCKRDSEEKGERQQGAESREKEEDGNWDCVKELFF